VAMECQALWTISVYDFLAWLPNGAQDKLHPAGSWSDGGTPLAVHPLE
jgi:hypothetical protein